MASRGAQRSYAEKQALKEKTKNAERYSLKREGRRRDFTNEIEFNNAATSGHGDEPIPTKENSRSAAADLRRAVAKGAGVMSLSKKHDPELKVAGVQGGQQDAGEGVKTSRGARAADKSLDKGSAKAGATAPLTRRAKSNAEIAESVPTTARKRPAPLAAPPLGGGATGGEPRRMNKRTGGARQRVPAPGNVVSAPKGELIPTREGAPVAENQDVTSSAGGRKPPKRPARAGHATGASKSKGADMGLEE